MGSIREKRITILVGIALFVVATLAVFSFVSFQRLLQTSRLLTQANRIVNYSEAVLKSYATIESGQRGYIITGNEVFLGPLPEADKTIELRLEHLDSLTREYPFQQARVKSLTRVTQLGLAWTEQVIQVREESFEKAQALVRTGRGKQFYDSIYSLINEIQTEERQRFQRQNTITNQSLQELQYSFIGLAIAIIAVISYLFYTVRKALKERKGVEQQLIKTSNDVKELYDVAPCGYLSVDRSINLSNINQTLLNWLGYSAEEVMGKMKFEDLLSPKSREQFLQTFERDFQAFKEKGYVMDMEFEFQRKDGSVFPVTLSSNAIFDDQGEFVASRTTVFDNTNRKQNEELLREREERFRQIVSSVSDSIIILNDQGIILNWNKGAELTFGWSASEIVGKSLALVMPEKYRDLHLSGMKRFSAFNRSNLLGKTVELEGLRKDGTIFPLELSISSWKTGEQTFFGGILRNITERKKVEKQIAELASIVESTDDAIVAINGEGIILNWNKGAEKIYGYTPAEVQGKPINLIIPEEFHEQERSIIQQVNQGTSLNQYETTHLRKDGKRIDISLTISPIFDKARNIIGISKISRDITELKKRENKIKQLNKELDAFTYSVSHDLRAPLRSISGFAQILLEDYSSKLDDEGKRVTNVIIRNTNRMGNLIDDLLNFARMNRKKLTFSRINMEQLVRQVIQEFSENNGKLEIKNGEILPTIGDQSMITQVWVNLISNAVKYSSRNERIYIEIGSYKQNHENCYYVKDNGVGFSMDYANKLFGVFQRLHKADEFDGTGVGLALVKRIIQRHRGRVWAEGEVNKGATFYFSLPTATPATQQD
jgi:PAS domain S-box-containing protein